MATGFGIDPVKDAGGVITSGTSAADIRQIWGGLYTPGLISGGVVTTSPSALTYTVSAGVAVVRIATGQNVPIPIPATTVPTTKPSSGTRTDYVYAQQKTPSTDGSSDVIVAVGTTVPVRAVKLAQFTISSTNTNTNAAIRTLGVDYSIPYGGSLGILHKAGDSFAGVLGPNNVTSYLLSGSFYLPTDRRLGFSLTVSSSSNDGSDGTINDWIEPNFSPQLDNVDQAKFVWRATGTWSVQTFTAETENTVPAGWHTARVKRFVWSRGTRPLAMHINPKYSTYFSVTDLGVAV